MRTDQAEALAKRASRRKVTRAEVVREAIDAYLASEAEAS
jgi:predicted DNA-binding protein